MAKSSRQKLKILYVMKALMEQTDERHPMAIKDFVRMLNEYGLTVERKTIYDDLESLKEFGMDIENRRMKPAGYYLASRDFEVPELKLLVDAVQFSKFITAKKSEELIRKLEKLTNIHEAKALQRQVVVDSCSKSVNESVYYNIDQIHKALSEDRQISFQYYEWTIEKEMKLKKNGERYLISPWGLLWKDDNYYVIGLEEKTYIVKHFRVDKMLRIDLEDESRNGGEIFEEFNAAQFATRTFGMFGGREEILTLEFDNQLVGVVIDRFGQDINIHKIDDEHFSTMVKVNVSYQFFGWLTGLGAGAKIAAPLNVQEEYKKFLKRAMENYKK